MNPHEITKKFEEKIADYTGAPYCVCVDNQSNALSMALTYIDIHGVEITIPSNTYPSVPCEVILAGGKVRFNKEHPSLRDLNKNELSAFTEYFKEIGVDALEAGTKILTGEYQLEPTNVWDSALRFTTGMYRPGQFQCLSFTGQWKRLKTVKGGAILTDDEEAYNWFKRFRFSGRREKDYHTDHLDFIGKNYYMPHILASIGLQMLSGFYNIDRTKKTMEDLSLPYPDLSKFPIYNT
jgi:perosamine synthetase